MHLCIIFLSRLYLSPDASKLDISKITPPHLRARGKAVVEPEALRSLGDYHYAKIFTIKLQNCTWIKRKFAFKLWQARPAAQGGRTVAPPLGRGWNHRRGPGMPSAGVGLDSEGARAEVRCAGGHARICTCGGTGCGVRWREIRGVGPPSSLLLTLSGAGMSGKRERKKKEKNC